MDRSIRGARQRCDDCKRPFYDLNRAVPQCPRCGGEAVATRQAREQAAAAELARIAAERKAAEKAAKREREALEREADRALETAALMEDNDDDTDDVAVLLPLRMGA